MKFSAPINQYPSETRRIYSTTMFIRASCILLISVQIVSTSGNTKNATNEAKTKRGIYQVTENIGYDTIPAYHLPRDANIRALSEDASQIDITFKPDVEVRADHSQISNNYQAYDHPNQLKVPSNHANYKTEEPTYSAQHNVPAYAPNYYAIPYSPKAFGEHYHVPHHYIAPVQRLTLYGSDKPLHLPSRTVEFADSYSPVPIVYGQPTGVNPSLKYVHPKSQYTLTPSYSTVPLNQQYKLPAKLHSANLQLQRSPYLQTHQPLVSSTPVIQNSHKAFHPNFYRPQVFENPIVPQLQHYIPPVQSPFDAFTKPVTSAPVTVSKHPKPKPKPSEDEDDRDDDRRREHREEIKGELVRHEINDEDEFDKGYKDAARGFPVYDDDDDYDSRYKNDDDSDDRHGKYRARYENDYDDDRRGRYEYDDDRRGRYRSDHDHEGHYSQKYNKKEPRDKHRDSQKKSKHSYKNDDEEYSSSKKSRYHKSDSHPSKTQSEARYAKKHSKKSYYQQPKETASTKSEVEFKPSYQYGFEPIKNPREERIVHVEDSEAKQSSPSSTKKVYKENWYITKTSKSSQ